MPPDLKIYSHHEPIDHIWVLAALQASYWGAHYTASSLRDAISKSVCVSAYVGQDQVGFARVITDWRLLSMLTDVIVDEKWRRQGIATAMLEKAFEHPWVKPTLCVCQTRHHYPLYAKFGFVMGGEMLKRNPT